MSVSEHTDTIQNIDKKSETRRNALLRRMDELMHEMEHIRLELMDYSITITEDDLTPVFTSLVENKTRLIIDLPEEGMENVLAMYSPKDHEIVQKDPSIDAITEAAMLRLIEREEYTCQFELKGNEKLVALRFRVGDEHHGKTIGDGMLLISSLSKTSNDAQWVAFVEEGQLVYNEKLENLNATGLQDRIEAMLELEEGPSLQDLSGYYLFVGNGDLFTGLLEKSKEVEQVEMSDSEPAVTLEEVIHLAKSPSDDYLAKIGPNGRIRYRSSTAEMAKSIKDKGRDPKMVLGYINDLALDRVDDAEFVYVVLK